VKPKKIPYEKYKEIYSLVPRITVEVLIIENDSILLTKRSITPAKGFWHTPGGAVLKGEKLEETVRRVAKEEVGLDIKIEKFADYIEYESFKEYFGHDISFAFVCKKKNTKQQVKLDDNADDYKFFSKLPAKMIPEQRKIINTLGIR